MAAEGREVGASRPQPSSRGWVKQAETVAANRHRILTRDQLLSFGATPGQIRQRLSDGRLVRRYRGVYSWGPGDLDLPGRFMAAVAYAGEDASLAGPAAAAHNELADWLGGPIDVICPRRVTPRPGLRIHRCTLAPDERSFWRGISVTTTGRTVLDCAALRGVRDVENLFNEAFVKNIPLKPLPSVLLSRYRGARGTKTLRAALHSFEGGPTPTRSDLEEDYLAFLDRHGFPRPATNYAISTDIGVLSVDCAWPERRIALEVDAPSTHGSRPRMRNDRRRDRALRRAGWDPARIMEEDLDNEDELAREMRGLLFGSEGREGGDLRP